mgnify:CR=1 FL=1
MQLKWIVSLLVVSLLLPLISSSVYAETPPSPQGPHVWCLSGQAAVKLNWFPADGATSYQVRIDADTPSWDGTCSTPDSCLTTNSNEITVPITPGKTYDWWVHAVNANGWSQPAMTGVEFKCTLPIPVGLHYQCKPNNTVTLNWYDTNPAHLYEVAIDENPSSWNATCDAPDRCISVTENSTTLTYSPNSEYAFWVQSKDTKGNISAKSQALAIRCANPVTPTLTIEPSILPTSTPTTSPSSTPHPTFLPTPTITAQPPTTTVTDTPLTPMPDCPRRTEGDANCDGAITIEDSRCWEKVYAINFLSTGARCRYTNFDEIDGTNILDYAIWYVNWEL